MDPNLIHEFWVRLDALIGEIKCWTTSMFGSKTRGLAATAGGLWLTQVAGCSAQCRMDLLARDSDGELPPLSVGLICSSCAKRLA